MSKTKRYEKEIDYLKFLMGGIVVMLAGMAGWIINGTLIINSILLQISAGILIFILILGIIYLHIKIKNLLTKLEATND